MSESYLIGLTGGIGAGKSVVSRILRLRGEKVYDCDFEARMLMENDEALRNSLSALCGPEIYTEDRLLDRRRMGQLIFSDDIIRQKVNRLVHSAVRRDVEETWRAIRNAGGKRMFVESAILFSSGLAEAVDEIWIVEAPEDLRVSRVCARSGLTPEEVRSRIQAQRGEMKSGSEGKRVRIINNRSGLLLLPQID